MQPSFELEANKRLAVRLFEDVIDGFKACFTFQAMDLFRIEEGRIAEHWDVIQRRGLLSSLVLMVAG